MRLRQSFFNTFLLVIYVSLSVLFFVLDRGSKPYITVMIVLLSFASLLYGQIYKHVLFLNVRWAKVLMLAFFAGLCFQLINGNFTLDLVYILAAPSFAYFVYKNKFDYNLIYGCYIVLCIYMFQLVLSSSGEGLNSVFEDASRNTFSIIMLVSTVLLYIIAIKCDHKVNLWPALTTLVISTLAMGRSGIICSLLLFGGLGLECFKTMNTTKRLIWVLSLVMPLAFLSIVYVDTILAVIYNMDELEYLLNRGFESDERSGILEAYLERMNIVTIIIGYNYANIPIIEYFSLNPHNSYIRFHSYVGVVSIFFIGLFLKRMIPLYSRYRFLFLLSFVLLLRAWTDSVFFFSMYDFIIYLILFSSYSIFDKNVKYSF